MSSSKKSSASSSSSRHLSEQIGCKKGNADDGKKKRKLEQQHVTGAATVDEPPPLTGSNYDKDDDKQVSHSSEMVSIPTPSPTEINLTTVGDDDDSDDRNNDNDDHKVPHYYCSNAVATTDQSPSSLVDEMSDCTSSRSRRRVQFSWNNNDTDEDNIDGDDDKSKIAVIKEVAIPSKISYSAVGGELPALTPLPSAIHHHKRRPKSDDNSDVVVTSESEKYGFSDSVLTLPNLPEFKQKCENNNVYKIEQGRGEQEENDDNEQRNIIARKTPKTNFVQFLQSKVCSRETNGQGEVDANNNFILWPSASKDKLRKHVSCLFQADASELERLAKLLPRGREYVMFNVFTDIGRLFYRKRRKHVVFPKEFLEKYQEQGDVAGKDRVVPVSLHSIKGIPTSKKRKLSAVYSSWTVKSSAFQPRVDRVDDVTRCEVRCERYCVSCDCCKISSGKPDLSNVMSPYCNDLNLASAFLHGHASRTFESALSNLEFIKFHDCPTTLIAQTPWSLRYTKQNLGILSGSIWMFTYCIRTIITQTREKNAEKDTASIPTENSFRRVMEQYATMCVALAENVKTVLQYNHNFYNFCKECNRIIKVIMVLLGTSHEIRLKPPLKRGDGLQLNRTLSKRNITHQNCVVVKVAKSKPATETEPEEILEWKDFADLSGSDKAASLKSLLHSTNTEMNTVQTQLRFLLDDIVDSVKDVLEADFLYVLADMYDRVRVLQSYGHKRCKAEIEELSRATHEFCKDFQSFVDYGQHIMKRFIEYRDMIHLSYVFMVKGLKLESLSEMVPSRTFKTRRGRMGCCGGGGDAEGSKSKMVLKRRVVSSRQPKYKVLDFFRVYYWDAVKAKGEIYANKFTFFIDVGQQPIKAIIPVGTENIWGELDTTSPRTSFDEYAENEEDNGDGDLILGGGAVDKDAQLKPILVSAGGSTPPEVTSPRGSGGEDNLAAAATVMTVDKTATTTETTTPKGAKRGSKDSNEGEKKNEAAKK